MSIYGILAINLCCLGAYYSKSAITPFKKLLPITKGGFSYHYKEAAFSGEQTSKATFLEGAS